MKSKPLLALVAMTCAAVLGAAMCSVTGSDSDSVARQAVDTAAEAPGSEDVVAIQPHAERPDVREGLHATVPPHPAAPLSSPGAAPPPAAGYPLRLMITGPEGDRLDPGRLVVHLVDAEGNDRSYLSDGAQTIEGVVGLGVYRVSIESMSFRHVAETFDFSSESQCENGDPTLGFLRQLVLWPDQWIPVRIRTPAGAPFTALTKSLGWEAKRLFVGAFHVAASLVPFEPDAEPPAENADADADAAKSLARFHPPRGWQNVRIGDDVVGSLHVTAPRPMWVALWIHGTLHETRILEEQDTELLYVVGADAFESRLAQVRLRLVDRDSGAPVIEDARATLKAETSAHRRQDLQNRTPGDDGRIVFERVIPGLHDLTIERSGSIVQRKLALASGEVLDLTDVPIGADPAIILRVVDTEGRPAEACIELAPYVEGGDVEDLYHPNLHRTTDRKGVYELPVPEGLSIVRVRPMYVNGSPRKRYDVIGTRNVLIDPAAPPAEITLTVHMPSAVKIEVDGPWAPGHLIVVDDPALGLRIAALDYRGGAVHLVPGAYRILHLDEANKEIGARDVQVDGSTKTLSVP